MHPPSISHDSTLGPYRLIRKLGEGGMGTVHLAYDDTLDRHVAIKVLRLQDATPHAQAAMTKRFMREARSAARLNHPRVVTIYSIGQTEGSLPRPYLVMEYVEGGSLADQLHENGPMDWRTAAEAVRDALEALSAAHAAGIIHRDIKPANLMRAKNDGGIKLVDFGLARVFETYGSDHDLTFPGGFVGSPSYASPEQAAGSAIIDGRSDLYSLAATWFTLLAGRPPFLDDDPAEILRHHLSSPFPDLRQFADIPAPLTHLLTRASSKAPTDRYTTAKEMHTAVEQLLKTTHTATISKPRTLTPPKPLIEETLTELESQLALAKIKADSSTQLAALRGLYGLYTQLDRREDATKVFREALVLHVQIHAPTRRSA